jgi:hypothetical protein
VGDKARLAGLCCIPRRRKNNENRVDTHRDSRRDAKNRHFIDELKRNFGY